MLSRRYALALLAEVTGALFLAACSSSSDNDAGGGGDPCAPGYTPFTYYSSYYRMYGSGCLPSAYGPYAVRDARGRARFARYDGSLGGEVTMPSVESLTNRRRG